MPWLLHFCRHLGSEWQEEEEEEETVFVNGTVTVGAV